MSEASLIATNMKEAHKILGCSKEEAIQSKPYDISFL